MGGIVLVINVSTFFFLFNQVHTFKYTYLHMLYMLQCNNKVPD
jgi:hypothetical protein